MPIEHIRLAQSARDQLVTLKRRTGIDYWNVLCRWGLLLLPKIWVVFRKAWYTAYMASLVPIGVAARELGVHPDTLRRWEQEGRIEPAERTPGGRRRYDLAKLRQLGPHKAPSTRTTIAYARVSTNGQRDDLVRQVALLESFCAANGWTYEVISDVGSGLNYHKRGLKQLISRICSGEVGRLVLTHKDRLLRFGAELVFSLCEHFGTEVVIINASEESSFEEDLAQDVIEIVTVFSARLYGSRSHKNKQVMEQLRSIAAEMGT